MNSTKPDYEIARDEAKALFESLGIETQPGTPLADVKDGRPNILYRFSFTRKAQTLATEYRLGVGHVKWPRRYEDIPPGADVPVFNTLRLNPGAELKDKMEHAIAAALLARVQKVSPQPFEVLAAVCDDAHTAHSEPFESWAENFGMDGDSIKAKAVYDACGALYHKAAALIGADNVRKLAELHAQF